jgi:hypothetical protein
LKVKEKDVLIEIEARGFFHVFPPAFRSCPWIKADFFTGPTPVMHLLHTFCGQQCAQAPLHLPKLLISWNKLNPARRLSSHLSTDLLKVLHGFCG